MQYTFFLMIYLLFLVLQVTCFLSNHRQQHYPSPFTYQHFFPNWSTLWFISLCLPDLDCTALQTRIESWQPPSHRWQTALRRPLLPVPAEFFWSRLVGSGLRDIWWLWTFLYQVLHSTPEAKLTCEKLCK